MANFSILDTIEPTEKSYCLNPKEIREDARFLLGFPTVIDGYKNVVIERKKLYEWVNKVTGIEKCLLEGQEWYSKLT